MVINTINEEMSFCDYYSQWVDVYKNGPFQLVMKIHRCLMFMMFGVSIDEFLITHTIELRKLKIRDKLSQPRLDRKSVV